MNRGASNAEDLGGEVGGWMQKSEKAVVSDLGAAVSFGSELIGAVQAIVSVADAYRSCTGSL